MRGDWKLSLYRVGIVLSFSQETGKDSCPALTMTPGPHFPLIKPEIYLPIHEVYHAMGKKSYCRLEIFSEKQNFCLLGWLNGLQFDDTLLGKQFSREIIY